MLLFLAFISCFLVVALSGRLLVLILNKIGFTQYIRQEGPATHQAKQFTPTAGGLVFLFVIPIVLFLSFLFGKFNNFNSLYLPSFVLLCSAAIGFWDDYLKKVHKKNEGLKPKQKLAAQILLATIVTIWLARSQTNIFGVQIHLPIWLFGVFVFLVLSGAMNAANLTDGLDGLASSVLGWSYLGLAALLYLTVGESVSIIWALSLAGICFGFLRINGHPAKVFMGDTGSFFLGGGLAIIALLNGLEWFLIPLMAVSIWEVISVILQVFSCKISRRFYGKDWRPFKMTPFHHHLELSGWSERKVVFIMSTVQAFINIIFLSLLKHFSLV